MSVDTQFIITCSTLRITPYLSEANQVYSLSHLTLAWSILSAHFEPAKVLATTVVSEHDRSPVFQTRK